MDPLTMIALANQAINTGMTLAKFVTDTIHALKQKKEKTPEERTALDELIARADSQPHWQPDQT